jgi:7-carboxy-7-deazaguanine synthase
VGRSAVARCDLDGCAEVRSTPGPCRTSRADGTNRTNRTNRTDLTDLTDRIDLETCRPSPSLSLSQSAVAMLTVFETYLSIQGESTHTGRPCVFVRLAACNLRCVWCDTPYAFTGGTKQSVEDVVAAVSGLGCHLVELTGGEPLLQPEAITLMQRLVDDGFEVLLETGGHLPIDEVPDQVVAILDVKCPGSGEADKMLWPNLDQLSPHDEVKFVIGDRADFEYAVDVTTRYDLTGRAAAVLFSPVFGVLPPADLASWILDAGERASSLRTVRLQLQTHKYIWDPATRGV